MKAGLFPLKTRVLQCNAPFSHRLFLMPTSLIKQPLSQSELMILSNIEKAIFPPIPRSFAALMEMYEINYMQLRLLCGDIRKLEGDKVSFVESGIPLHMTILEQCRHTTMLLLTYDFENGDDPRPDLHIQVYHDSRQANVLSRRCNYSGEQVSSGKLRSDTQLLCHWRTNRFLFKWVKYLLRQGHKL